MKLRMLKLLAMVFLLVLVNGCSAITKERAEAEAVKFVNENVRFFTREANNTLGFPDYSIDSIESYKEGKDWVVVMHISAKRGNETKDNDLAIKVNNKGQVVEFNGRRVGR
jgi:hypothetical protein